MILTLIFVIGIQLGINCFLLYYSYTQTRATICKITMQAFNLKCSVKYKYDILYCDTLDTEGKKEKIFFTNYLN